MDGVRGEWRLVLQADGGQTGQLRILCDGQHEGEVEEKEETVDAIASEDVDIPTRMTPPRIEPPL